MKGEKSIYTRKILSFLRGELTIDEEQELLHWLKRDDQNREFFMTIQKSLEKEVVHTRDKKIDQQWKALKSRISTKKIGFVPKDKPFWKRKIVAIAAAFILGLIVPSTFIFLNKESEFSQNHQANEQISVPYGAKTNFKLPDGSVVWLNSGSKLSFPSQFRKVRTISLDGEAFFDVVKDDMPFIVSTNYGNIKVMGTAFNVKAYQDEVFQTTLVRGAVEVERSSGNSIILKPGQQSYLDDKNQLAKKSVNTEVFTSWREGRLIFYKEPFVEMAKRLERWYNVKIEVNNKNIENLRFTGTIEMETLSEVMELIQRTMPVQYYYDRNSRTLKIYKKGGVF
ncbi:FecR family protein [Sunxiuqinia indica]|uniref:FecR family protein n=1 Tax=Sunxiuqinia indica TaxID=2692584 RepID=UPI00135CEED3|nr:FecR domain-containing protein [Sunxiuqinia indica]